METIVRPVGLFHGEVLVESDSFNVVTYYGESTSYD